MQVYSTAARATQPVQADRESPPVHSRPHCRPDQPRIVKRKHRLDYTYTAGPTRVSLSSSLLFIGLYSSEEPESRGSR